MEKRNPKKDGGDPIDALLEKTAKKVQSAAKACRVGGGGLACLALDISAAHIRNAKAVGEDQARGGDANERGVALSAVPTSPALAPPTPKPVVVEAEPATKPAEAVAAPANTAVQEK